ncbi:MAG: thymidine kinase [Bacteroidia bacterium]|nr:thymidine kinase [Bacteroidia bacterium]HQU99774.1 thymidine kinase [Bacteroidia bacterium]
MFLEHRHQQWPKRGWIEVICGSMFSGKTEELIRRLKRAQIAKLKVEIFKPKIDNRYSEAQIVSHNANAIVSTAVHTSSEILSHIGTCEIVGIDEAQFFDDALPAVCTQLANSGVRVVVAGLDMDFTGKPFGSMPQLLSIAEYITKVHAICMHCGELAHNSHRLAADNAQILVGEKESYVPLCRSCFNTVYMPKNNG